MEGTFVGKKEKQFLKFTNSEYTNSSWNIFLGSVMRDFLFLFFSQWIEKGKTIYARCTDFAHILHWQRFIYEGRAQIYMPLWLFRNSSLRVNNLKNLCNVYTSVYLPTIVGENFLNLMSEMPKNALKLNIVNRQEIIKRLLPKKHKISRKYQEIKTNV